MSAGRCGSSRICGVLLCGTKAAKRSSWRLNPNVGWKGKVRTLRTVLDAHYLELVKDESQA